MRNIVLIIVSLIFYAWGEPVYILIMMFSTVFDYTNGRLIYKYREKKRVSRAILIGSLCVNLGLLCFFKYFGFITHNINLLFHLSIHESSLPLPLGISFYTFQTMSYVIDVYRGYVPAQRNFISFATYVTMFPQLVAGPIVKYRDVAKDITGRKESFDLFGDGVELFIIGLAKKVLIANNIGMLWTSVKNTPVEELSVLSAWLGITAFTFQIYFDFSGYSDMAVGLGKMLGFHIGKNFDYPYMSKSVTEFWRRWHISLGSWFREYVYIPLGGNRTTKFRHYRNLFVVWFLTGLWHGANWNFILWGLYYGIFVTVEKMFLLKWLEKRNKFVGHVYTLLVVIIGWAIFELEKIPNLIAFIGIMFGLHAHSAIDSNAVYYLYTNAIIFVIAVICSTPMLKNIMEKAKDKFKASPNVVLPVIYLAMLFICTAYLVNQSYNPFLYFRF